MSPSSGSFLLRFVPTAMKAGGTDAGTRRTRSAAGHRRSSPRRGAPFSSDSVSCALSPAPTPCGPGWAPNGPRRKEAASRVGAALASACVPTAGTCTESTRRASRKPRGAARAGAHGRLTRPRPRSSCGQTRRPARPVCGPRAWALAWSEPPEPAGARGPRSQRLIGRRPPAQLSRDRAGNGAPHRGSRGRRGSPPHPRGTRRSVSRCAAANPCGPALAPATPCPVHSSCCENAGDLKPQWHGLRATS